VAEERARGPVYPPAGLEFEALRLTPFESVKVVFVGQDPYHGEGQACGLAFAVPPGVRLPPSLRNLYRELADDVGVPPAPHGWLEPWARSGVLLLNATLTVRANEAGSHQRRGWEQLTDAAIDALNRRERPAVFVLLGDSARKKAARVTGPQHRVVQGVHPSPLSAHRGFFGSRLFSAVNRHLTQIGLEPVEWGLSGVRQ
jgi:uracil-DNA glycosylase